MPQLHQPFLHDLVCVLAAPTQVWSRRDGQIEGADGGAQGLTHADVRVLSELVVTLDGDAGEHVSATLTAAEGDELQVTTLHRRLAVGVLGPDPAVRSDRFRRVQPGVLSERLRVSSVLDEPIEVEVGVRLGSDLLSVEAIKQGGAGSPIGFRREESALTWGTAQLHARLTAPGAELVVTDDGAQLRWRTRVPARGQVEVAYAIEVVDTAGVVVAAPPLTEVGTANTVAKTVALASAAARSDRRIQPWVERALSDLAALRMGRPEDPDDVFYAAGAPWYFTLFGRDSLISARFMLPVDPSIAIGTLRTLAALQGRRRDPETSEEPGKIMHELRRAGTSFLPPLYYGTIDATPLWIGLLHEVWAGGHAPELVTELLPNLQAALSWLTAYGDADGDGFLEYLDTSGRGLANQGWKDSADSVRFADGTIATGPVALCEVQGYAYEAALGGAAMLEAYGLAGADDLRAWATNLATRFRERFWVTSRGRRFPALALDGAKRPVDSLTSNVGHLLGTGLLNAEEERAVAELVSGPELDSGLGLRTMSSADGGYAPLSYHCGSVWPHDTAMVIAGLLRAGLGGYARGLAEGLVAAAAAFDDRLPELYSGEGRPVPYPASCRPQAWAAAAVVPVLQSLGELSRPS